MNTDNGPTGATPTPNREQPETPDLPALPDNSIAPYDINVVPRSQKRRRPSTLFEPDEADRLKREGETRSAIKVNATAILQEHIASYPPVPTAPLPIPDDLARSLIKRRPAPADRAAPRGRARAVPPEWIIIVTVPLSAFLVSLFTELGKDAYVAVKQLVMRLRETDVTHQPQGLIPSKQVTVLAEVRLRDVASGLFVRLPGDLPDRAYQELATLRLPTLPPGCSPEKLQWAWVLDDGERWVMSSFHDESGYPLLQLAWQPAQQAWTLVE